MNGIAPFACSFVRRKFLLMGTAKGESLTSGMLYGLCHAGECGFDVQAKLVELDGRLLDEQKNLPDQNSRNRLQSAAHSAQVTKTHSSRIINGRKRVGRRCSERL